MNTEKNRLREIQDGHAAWRLWGPYLAERQWGTVREDYSSNGDAWDYFTHEMARGRAYRWGEDGLLGFCDERQRLCFSLALWNGRDEILKERLFGLTGREGNHGEDVKEYYYYCDGTPTHSYLKMLYKYPQASFPYSRLVEENRRRGKGDPEFELIDTGIFDDDAYFDVFVEYAKAAPDDVCILVTVHNRAATAAPLHLIPQLFFRNTWSWEDGAEKPTLAAAGDGALEARHDDLGEYYLYVDGDCEWLFSENETNPGGGRDPAAPGYYKDAFHEYIVSGKGDAVNPVRAGTKAAARCRRDVPAEGSTTVRLRLAASAHAEPFADFEAIVAARRDDADAFYAELQAEIADPDARSVQRQALAALLCSKQYYQFDVTQWLDGDPEQPTPPPARRKGRNHEWLHLNNADIISMPDKWEYPWYAAWDLAFHCIPLALVDPEFAKQQLVLLTREWYMHPNGQLPAYEWSFGDVNPPVHAWAAWRIYKIDKAHCEGIGDLPFLERVFHKLLLNFTWWVNRKDTHGNNLFEGGFLGLDNIGVFDRSRPLPVGGHIEQADGTAWMAMYCLNMMRIALELAVRNPVYQDLATKFFEHFLYIAGAMTNIGGEGISLWDEDDEFFYDVLHLSDSGHDPGRGPASIPLKIRSMVGLIPLFAVETLDPELLEHVPDFKRRMEWFLNDRPDLAGLISHWQVPGLGERRLLSLLRGHRMKCLLRRALDESEFLSDFGIRALSRHHAEHPYVFHVDGTAHEVRYLPAESDSGLFGGNSNWRGPIWFPVNYLIIESLQKFHHYYGDDFKVECPTGSGSHATIDEIADELARRLTRIFLRDEGGRRAVFGDRDKFQNDPHWRDHLFFQEYFHGDNGRGVGALQQAGWTALVAKLLQPRRLCRP